MNAQFRAKRQYFARSCAAERQSTQLFIEF